VIIDSVKKLTEQINSENDTNFKPQLVSKVMRTDLGMRFKKIRQVSLHENSVRNLVLRQRWAVKFLELVPRRHRVINIDETWIGMEDFRRMKWQQQPLPNSVAKKLWQPRVSLIVAFDNFGEVYLAVSQSNTNSNSILLFVRALVAQLNVEDRHWREKTIIFWDGAAYHQSAATLKLLDELQVPMMVSGPHSYDVAPCELWFSLFKRADINPRKVKTGKR